jgi:hypothetical protein
MRNALETRLRGTVAILAMVCILAPPPATAQAQARRTAASQPATAQAQADWPRVIEDGQRSITVYQPQIESWRDDRLEARAAVAVDKPGPEAQTLGVVWFKAHTQVDKESDLVRLDDIEVARVSFPSDPANAEAYADALRRDAGTQLRSISLARLQASLAVAEAEATARAFPVRNDPPKIVFSESPALLVLVDGKPQLRQIAGSRLLRVINTPALILFDEGSASYHLRALERWWSAKAPEGPWSVETDPPSSLAGALKAAGSRANLMDEAPPEIAAAVARGAVPRLEVSLEPAELIQTGGPPEYAPIPDTQLLYVKNTGSQIIVDVASQDHYVLIAGRWFRSKSLAEGPWSFVASDQLPADFAKIPESHPKGDVLASVSGTVQAQESLIDNQVPQTATVDRHKARLSVHYDGKPELKPIPGTSLTYVVNASVPVIEVASAYYAIENGVWFTAASLDGPWRAASEVPAAIYAIPPEAPLHYVTYAKVYRSTADTVYVGYTPGYYGTVAAPGGVVVYGTGYLYPAWVGAYWYPAPLTYGYGAAFAWGAATGFAIGAVAGAAWSGGAWGWGWNGWGWHGGGNVVINNVNFNHANIYNRWSSNTVRTRIDNRIGQRGERRIGQQAGSRIGERAEHRVGARGHAAAAHVRQHHPRANDLYAGRHGEVMRRGSQGWQHHQNGRWAHAGAGDFRHFDRAQAARVRGERLQHARMGAVRGGGFHAGGIRGGGFHGGGFHGGGFHGGGFHGGGFHGRRR